MGTTLYHFLKRNQITTSAHELVSHCRLYHFLKRNQITITYTLNQFQCELGKFVSIGIGAEDERKQVVDAIFPVDPKE